MNSKTGKDNRQGIDFEIACLHEVVDNKIAFGLDCDFEIRILKGYEHYRDTGEVLSPTPKRTG